MTNRTLKTYYIVRSEAALASKHRTESGARAEAALRVRNGKAAVEITRMVGGCYAVPLAAVEAAPVAHHPACDSQRAGSVDRLPCNCQEVR